MSKVLPAVAAALCISGSLLACPPEKGDAAKLVTLEASCETSCNSAATDGPSHAAMVRLVAALKSMEEDSPARELVMAALVELAKVDGSAGTVQLVKLSDGDATCATSCSSTAQPVALQVVSTDEQACQTTCSSSAPVAFVVQANDAPTCSTAPAAAIAVKSTPTEPACCASADKASLVAMGVKSPESSCCAEATKAAALVASVDEAPCGSGCSATGAKYVAFGCEKSDRIARAAAKAYMAVMAELKDVAGAKGCSVKTAQDVLTAMVDDMQAERVAAAGTTVETVSFGIVSDAPATCAGSCSTAKATCADATAECTAPKKN